MTKDRSFICGKCEKCKLWLCDMLKKWGKKRLKHCSSCVTVGEQWLCGKVCKFQAWLLSISEAVLSPCCPRCPASQRRYAETQHIKWDVTCTATLFYLYCMRQHWGKNAKKRSPAAWWGLVALQARRGDSVIFTLRAEGGRETSPPQPMPPLCSPPCPYFSQRQRKKKIADNYLLWNFLTVSVSATWCVGVTKLIFDWFLGHAPRLLCRCMFWMWPPMREKNNSKNNGFRFLCSAPNKTTGVLEMI